VAHTEHVRTGSRQGLLPWSREKQTSQLNLRAERLAAEGKADAAKYALRRSLELAPLQPDAIRMQQAISGETDFWPNRSMMDAMVSAEMASRAAFVNVDHTCDHENAADQDQAAAPTAFSEFFDFVLAPDNSSEAAPTMTSPMNSDSNLFFEYDFAESQPVGNSESTSDNTEREVVTSPTPDD
jgi:hypothetical protein